MMRAFIAIALPKEIRDSLAKLEEELRLARADVKWVEPVNIHLTLKFLGEIDEEKFSKIIQIMEDIASDNNSFYFRLSSIGAFPKINFPRVIWVGIDKGDSETKKIAKALEERIAKIGIPKEDRTFSSHITIGRTRSALNRERLVESLNNLTQNFGQENLSSYKTSAEQSANSCSELKFLVTKIALFKSTLTPKGPIYEVLKEANLKTS